MGEATVWLNGHLVAEQDATISIFDRGFTLADGVFETMLVKNGCPVWLSDHLVRLRQGASVLGIPVPFDDEAIGQGLASLILVREMTDASLRLTLTRGPSRVRGLWPPAKPAMPTLLATLSPFTSVERPALKLVIAQNVRRNEHSPLSRIKSLNYGDNIVARREVEARGADDCLLMNGAGRVVCSSVGNIFARIKGEWRTPPIVDGVLAGIARQYLIPILEARETAFTLDDIAHVEAMFLANSLGLSAVGSVDGRVLEDISGWLTGLSRILIA